MGKLARFIYFYTNADKGKKPPKFDWQTITGTPPLSLTDAIAHGIKSLV